MIPRLQENPDGSFQDAPASLDDMDNYDDEADRAYEIFRQREIDEK